MTKKEGKHQRLSSPKPWQAANTGRGAQKNNAPAQATISDQCSWLSAAGKRAGKAKGKLTLHTSATAAIRGQPGREARVAVQRRSGYGGATQCQHLPLKRKSYSSSLDMLRGAAQHTTVLFRHRVSKSISLPE